MVNELINRLFGLDGRIIVVAGGAGQIGFAFCEILASAGARVIIADIDTDLAKTKLANLDKPGLIENFSVHYVNVSSKDSVDDLFSTVNEQYGDLYGLVNCFHFKGDTRKLNTSSDFFRDFNHYPEEAWDLVHDINLKGSFLMCQAAVSYMEGNEGGVIVNISSTYGNVSANKSIYGTSGINSPVSYATSKAGIINLTRYLATHLADKNIRVNCLSPGGVFNNQSREFVENYEKLTPLGRMADEGDYQGAVLFMMSDASSYMTGSNLIVDGGWTAW